MSTLYYTSVFFLYAQEIRSSAPFSEVDATFGEGLHEHLQQVCNAFARTEDARTAGEKGLWEPVQTNMGASVKKGDWYKSYTEFSRLFVEIGGEREDHVFLRALDFYGAIGDPPYPLLDTDGATRIINALDGLMSFLHDEADRRKSSLAAIARDANLASSVVPAN